MYYIQRKDLQFNDLETVDEFEDGREARRCLEEYRLCDQSAHYYISQRACKHWTEAHNANNH